MENSSKVSIGKHSIIKTKNVSFCYNKSNPVLKNVFLNIKQGQMFALLGSNGCGKTTLLNILLGRIKINVGKVRLFGQYDPQQDNRFTSHIIGYMPQDLGLNPLLTVWQTFQYFSRVNHVHDQKFLNNQIEQYQKTIDVDSKSKTVGSLSGGQKRLLSLMVTLMHQPKILLLDEPTVGIDSLIRHKIWNHLKNLCYNQGVTIIITTHYIDEAKNCDMVGFLHNGHILKQKCPQKLMASFKCQSLEQVFLRLCCNHETSTRSNGKTKSVKSIEQCLEVKSNSVYKEKLPLLPINQHKCIKKILSFEHLLALILREWYFFCRSFWSFCIQILLPLITLFFFNWTYGRVPIGIPVGLVNLDNQFYQKPSSSVVPSFSSVMIDIMNKNRQMKLNWFKMESELIKSIEQGQNVMGVVFSQNFTNAMWKRYFNYFETKRLNTEEFDSINARSNTKKSKSGRIRLYYDNSRMISSTYMNISFYRMMQYAFPQYGLLNGLHPMIFNTPIQMIFVYGGFDPNFQDFLASGIITLVLFGINVAKSVFELNYHYHYGCFQRDLIQGVSSAEILIAYLIKCSIEVLIHVLVICWFAFYVIQFQILGSFIDIVLLVLGTTYQGLFIAVIISVMFKNQVVSMVLSFTVIVTLFLSSGIMWPLEAMPLPVQNLFLLNPIVLPIRSMRNIMLRGWKLTNLAVLSGFLMNCGVCLTLLLFTFVLFHRLNLYQNNAFTRIERLLKFY